MAWLISGLGAALALVGGYTLWNGISYIRLDWGQTQTVAGTVAVCAGIVTLALAAILSALRDLLARAEQRPSGVGMEALTWGEDDAPVARPMMGRVKDRLASVGLPKAQNAAAAEPGSPSSVQAVPRDLDAEEPFDRPPQVAPAARLQPTPEAGRSAARRAPGGRERAAGPGTSRGPDGGRALRGQRGVLRPVLGRHHRGRDRERHASLRLDGRPEGAYRAAGGGLGRSAAQSPQPETAPERPPLPRHRPGRGAPRCSTPPIEGAGTRPGDRSRDAAGTGTAQASSSSSSSSSSDASTVSRPVQASAKANCSATSSSWS